MVTEPTILSKIHWSFKHYYNYLTVLKQMSTLVTFNNITSAHKQQNLKRTHTEVVTSIFFFGLEYTPLPCPNQHCFSHLLAANPGWSTNFPSAPPTSKTLPVPSLAPAASRWRSRRRPRAVQRPTSRWGRTRSPGFHGEVRKNMVRIII